MMKCGAPIAAATTLILVSLHAQQPPLPPRPSEGTVFRSDVELISVNATVLDSHRQFVPELRREDFIVYEDDAPQTVTQFSAGRVPLSLGIALDTSASMSGEKMPLAKVALDSLLESFFSPEDEFLLYGFSDHPALLQDWTREHSAILRALDRAVLGGNTAMYDLVADAIPRVQRGRNPKKALVLISDGSDNRSGISVQEVKELIRGTEALVYAIGIDCTPTIKAPAPRPPRHQVLPTPLPFRFPRCPEPVAAGELHDMTDGSGGRTEIISNPRDLEKAVAGIADELSQQYYLGYSSNGKKDGRWHSIRVEMRNHTYQVRARRGYLAK